MLNHLLTRHRVIQGGKSVCSCHNYDMELQYKEIINFVNACRSLLEQPDIKKLYIGFNDFPHGSCNDASVLVALMLTENGFNEFDCVIGENKAGATHSWLQSDYLLIDITADQFTNTDTVLFLKGSRREEHLGYRVSKTCKPKVSDIANTYSPGLIAIYHIMKSMVKLPGQSLGPAVFYGMCLGLHYYFFSLINYTSIASNLCLV